MGAVRFLAVVGVTLLCGCAPPTVDYHRDQSSVIRESPATGRCDLYTTGGSLVASKTIVAGEPIGFRTTGAKVLALAGPYEIPVAAGDYAWVVVEAHGTWPMPPYRPSAFHMQSGIRSRVR